MIPIKNTFFKIFFPPIKSCSQNSHKNNKSIFYIAFTAISLSALYFMNEEKKSEVPSGAFKNWYGFGVKKLDYQGPFYHATKSEESLKNILVEGGVQPKNREASYVSQKPENFGVYVLVFHDNLRLHKDESPRAYKSLSETENGAWVGFCGRLPTNDKYLAGIVLNKTFADKLLLTEGAKVNEEARANLQEKVQLWTGREIIVELDTHLTELDPEKLRQNNHS